jgi:hypothetical protein
MNRKHEEHERRGFIHDARGVREDDLTSLASRRGRHGDRHGVVLKRTILTERLEACSKRTNVAARTSVARIDRACVDECVAFALPVKSFVAANRLTSTLLANKLDYKLRFAPFAARIGCTRISATTAPHSMETSLASSYACLDRFKSFAPS